MPSASDYAKALGEMIPRFGRNLAGSAEAGYSLAHNLGAELLGRVGGVVGGGLGENNRGPALAAELTRQMSYEPRLPEARGQLQVIADVLGKLEPAKIPPWPVTAGPPRVGSGGLAGLEQAAEMNARPMVPPPAFMSPATVYHGSPHKFDKFDASKIGTGEGAQAYGHGLYFAENPKVAEGYAKTISVSKQDPTAIGILHQHGTKDAAIAEINRRAKLDPDFARVAPQKIKAIEASDSANLYKADIPDSMIPKMLDWEKPFASQPENVKKALLDFNPMIKFSNEEAQTFALHQFARSESGAKKLAELGLPGIKYLDQGSRLSGKGTYNYVVFPGFEKEVKILERK